MFSQRLPLFNNGSLHLVQICWVHSGQIVLSRFQELADPNADTDKVFKVQGFLIHQLKAGKQAEQTGRQSETVGRQVGSQVGRQITVVETTIWR